MIKEYALDPELLSDWQTCRFLKDKFSYGCGRVISRYPKKWTQKAHQALETDLRPIEKQRFTEAINQLKQALYSRYNVWDDSKSWVENAIQEHGTRPFHTIISINNPNNDPSIIKEADLDDTKDPWKTERQRHIQRTANEMAQCAELLLRNAQKIIFVDPYFKPDANRFKIPFAIFLKIVSSRHSELNAPQVEIHADDISAGVSEHFKSECKRHLPAIIPRGIKVRMVRWDKDSLHNRYILTEKGGLEFPAGLDQCNKSTTTSDNVGLLDREPYLRTWAEYQLNTSPLKLVESDLIIEGTAT